MSDIEGKVTRVGTSEHGQRTSFNGANGMNTPRWEAGGWTALVGGNPTEPIGRSRVNDIEGKATRVGARMEPRGREQHRWANREVEMRGST